jgi:hypothetical protein
VLTGDIFSTTSYPIIDLQNGGSINGIIDALNFILDLTIPAISRRAARWSSQARPALR